MKGNANFIRWMAPSEPFLIFVTKANLFRAFTRRNTVHNNTNKMAAANGVNMHRAQVLTEELSGLITAASKSLRIFSKYF